MNKESERMAVIKIKGFTYKFAWLYFEDLSSNLPCANSLIIEFLNLTKIALIYKVNGRLTIF